MRVRKKIIWGMAVLLAVLVSALPVLSGAAFAEDSFEDEYGNYVEWWNYRNTDSNNAVTQRPTPTNDKEAWGKWAVTFGTGWEASPTPPVIVNDKLYIGVNNQIIEVDKETGQELRRSEEMPGNVGYAIQSPLYADGRIFVGITNGRIAAINLSDLSLAWTTDNSSIIKGQTVSPISYVKIDGTGYVYTGTWTSEGGDLICATTDDSNVNNKIKKLTWHFDPQKEDAENLDANNCVACGYYWTGAYVTEKYLAIGADNGSTLGSAVNDTAFYTLDPQTGKIIDAVYGIKGQVRSSAVYENGYLYFSTQGAVIYKVPVDENGHLGNPSYLDMTEYGAEMATATPVVYGGKIYLGAQGKGGQFNSDGGHAFIVVRNDAVLSQASFAYSIPVPGYPQAGALLSNYHENEDFDGDGIADKRVYLFFTYNAPPGGIFYTYDTPDQTEPTTLTMEEARIFIPASAQQEYCISPIVVDETGILYFKNDSCYLFAVESNPAALQNLEVLDDKGEALRLDQEYQAKIGEYKCVVETEAEYAQLKLTLEEGVTATVDGTAYSGGLLKIDLPDVKTEVRIITDKGGKSRTYVLTLTKASADSDLSALGSAINNMAPSATNQNTRRIYPEFRRDETSYTFDWITTGTGRMTGVIDPATKTMMNIFLKADSDKATVAVFPEENVDQPSNTLNPDGSIKRNEVSDTVYDSRYPVYSADVTKDSTARIVVTAEDGITTKEYFVTFNRRIYVTDVSLDQNTVTLETGETTALLASVTPLNATNPTVIWNSSDERVAVVDKNGTITAVGEGTAIIKAVSEDGPSAECKVSVFPEATVVKNANGWWYMKGGKIDYSYTGFAKNAYGWWYVEKGQVTFKKNDIISGKANTDPNAEGEDGWWYVVNSQVTKKTTVASNKYGWWYVKDGNVDFTYNGVEPNDYGWWCIHNGKVDFNYTGYERNTYGWWYIEKGQVTFKKNDIISGKANTDPNAEGEDGWWYVVNSQVTKKTTVASNKYGWWYVKDGKVDFTYTGFADNDYGTWYIQDGKVDFSFNGSYNERRVIDGKAQ